METSVIIVTGIFIFCSILWFYYSHSTILHPFIFIALICFMVQVIGPLDWKITGKRNYRGIPIMDYIIQAELVFVIGYAFFWLFYAFTKGSKQEPKSTVIIQTKLFAIDIDVYTSYVLFFICLFLYFLYLRIKGRSFLSQLTLGQIGEYSKDTSADSGLIFLTISINMLITISCILLFISKSNIRYLLYLITLLLTISSGQRHLMLDIFLCPIIAYYLINNKEPKLVVIVIVVAVSFLLVGWIGAMRGVYRTGQGELTAFNEKSAWDAVMTNLEVFLPLCIYIPNLTLPNQFALGSTYISAFIQLVPGIIFPFKNQLLMSLDWGEYRSILGRQLLTEGIAGTYWSLLYANGWVIGVILGMSFLGYWIKQIERKSEYRYISYTIEFCILTTFMFQFLTRSFGNAIQDLLGLVLPLVILRRISFSGPKLENKSNSYIR